MSTSQVHKAGPLKQTNKPHKHGRHRSKGNLNTTNKGRVSIKVASQTSRVEQRRVDKKNKLKQLRSNKRHEALLAKRSIGSEGNPPHLIVIVPLSPHIDSAHLHSHLCAAGGMDDAVFTNTITLVCPSLKQRFTIVHPSHTDLYALLDIAKIADTLLFVYKIGEELSDTAQLTLDCCSSQGLPTTVLAYQAPSGLSGKALVSARKHLQKTVEKRFSNEKLHSLNSIQDANSLLRFISNHKRRVVQFKQQHAHLLAERLHFEPTEGQEYGTLKMTGYIRGKPLSVNGLVHIPGLGDFPITQIDGPPDPRPLRGVAQSRMEKDRMDESTLDEVMEEDIKVLEVADPAKQWSLESEVAPDPMEGEQTWPSEEELVEVQANTLAQQRSVVRKKVPRGTSDYQAAWIINSGSEEESEGESEEDLMSAAELSDDEISLAHTEMDTDTMTLPDTDKYDSAYDAESDLIQLEKLKAERDHLLFPDEVDTPQHIPARVRFQKFRGLKSFRSSPWDSKENLPRDYARIFQFENFRCTKKRVLSKCEDEGVLPGWYVTVQVDKVPKMSGEALTTPLVMYGLLPHENKMSVLNFVLKRTPHYDQPIKSKEELVFHSGVRRFSAHPIFSEHTKGDKHKLERFFHAESVCVATVFAPIGYPPQPVLVFKPEQGRHVLVATGSLHSVDPDRVVCKRVVLSGHPFKINKRSAVVRYMFFNRDDILWFKPVELRTKYGRRGHIKEPLGTHGHMKCVFDGQLKAQDTILMNLYKRVFPKWTYSMSIPTPLSWEYGNETMQN